MATGCELYRWFSYARETDNNIANHQNRDMLPLVVFFFFSRTAIDMNDNDQNQIMNLWKTHAALFDVFSVVLPAFKRLVFRLLLLLQQQHIWNVSRWALELTFMSFRWPKSDITPQFDITRLLLLLLRHSHPQITDFQHFQSLSELAQSSKMSLRAVSKISKLNVRTFSKASKPPKSASQPKAEGVNANVPGLSANIVKPNSQPVGPGASVDGQYKVPEYYCFNRMSYHEAEVEMAKYRCPQPSALKWNGCLECYLTDVPW